MAPIPSIIMNIPNPKKVLPSLKKHWVSMLAEIHKACNDAVQRFLNFNPVDILKTRCFNNVALAYKNMQRVDSKSVEDKTILREPEETDPTYKILATSLNVE